MNEKRLYDQLMQVLREKTSTKLSEIENVSFILVSIIETADAMAMGSVIIDPDLPESVENPPVNRNMAQQVTLHLSRHLEQPFSEALEVVKAMRAASSQVGLETFVNLVLSSSNAEEFSAKMDAATGKKND